MKISIITATYNCENLIDKTLTSIENQDFKNIECIIIDGKSEDNTLQKIEKYKNRIKNIVIISELDNGLYEAMNKGLRLATGDIIAILNAGDYYTTNNILSLVATQFIKKTNLEALYGDLEYINDKEKVVRYWKSGVFNIKKIYRGWIPPHPTFFVRNDVYKKYGYFNEDLEISADYELMLRFLLKHKITTTYISKVIVKMPIGGKSNASLKNRIQAHLEDRLSWKENNLQPKFYTVTLKPLSKIVQFFNKKRK